jgi:hypothetical protein
MESWRRVAERGCARIGVTPGGQWVRAGEGLRPGECRNDGDTETVAHARGSGVVAGDEMG